MKKIFLALSVFLFFASNCFAGLPSSEYSSDANTQLLLHMNGTDGSTTFTDSGNTVHTVTAVGNAQIDTAQSKFGGASGLFDGTGDYLSIPDHADWYFGSVDFTVDFWFRKPGTSDVDLFGQGAFGVTTGNLFGGTWHSLHYVYFSNGSAWKSITGNITLAANTWYHYAIVRNGNTLTAYIDGIADGSVDLTGVTGVDAAAPWLIGTFNGGIDFNGWIEEFRISKGIARWTSNFATDRRIIFAQ